jgi:5-(carboxyamino)imidazole ribonucleotide synthase
MSNPLKKRIGIIGGGQLGRMMIEESLRLNLTFNVLENDPDCPCASLCHTFIQGSLQDAGAIEQLAAISDVLTYEIEHVNTDALLALEAAGKEVIPSAKLLQVIQDKGLQKQFFADHDIPTSPFVLVQNKEDWKAALVQLNTPKIAAKTRRDGYDGKGVMLLDTRQIMDDEGMIPFAQPCVLEAFVECEKEISIMVSRDREGNTVSFPAVEMEFDPKANLVTYLLCPAHIPANIETEARQIAIKAISALNGIGIFAVEMFLGKDGKLWVNEIAPRAHNSGHHTIEACYTSQFEQWARILSGMPMGSTELIKPAVMINLLGADDFEGSWRLDGLEETMATEGVYIHLYDKKKSKSKRKMGHVTILGHTPEDAHTKATQVSRLLQFKSDQQ